MAQQLNALALAYSLTILSAAVMLILGIFGNIGIYTGAVEQMQQWHMFFSLSIGGIIAGMIEAAVMALIFGYAFGVLYNRFC